MRDQIIHYVTHDTSRFRIPNTEAFVFRKDRPHHWLQRLALAVLRRLGCNKMEDQVSTTVRTINVTRLANELQRQIIGCRRAYVVPKAVAIGSETLQKLLHEEADSHFVQPMQFTVEGQTLFGLRIIVVPWIDGVVVLPEVP